MEFLVTGDLTAIMKKLGKSALSISNQNLKISSNFPVTVCKSIVSTSKQFCIEQKCQPSLYLTKMRKFLI